MAIRISALERSFDTLWALLDGPQLTPEHHFDSTRRWRLDRAHLAAKVGIELDGGTWNRGRHSREPGYSNDCEKINAAQADGWAVFRLTGPMLENNPHYHLTLIKLCIERRIYALQN